MMFPLLRVQFIHLFNKLRGHLLKSLSNRDIILISDLHYLLLHLLYLLIKPPHRGDILLSHLEPRAYRVDPLEHARVLIPRESLHHHHLILQVLYPPLVQLQLLTLLISLF
jgi:hypothetical protein